jgi:glutamate N-acetyltransferase/amino-acid N-acetyltransferase
MSETHVVPGFDAAGIMAGIKKNGAADLALIASALPCSAAAVFTRNLFTAAPVKHGKRLLGFNNHAIHAVLINAGCANAVTGVEGDVNARLCAEATEQALGALDNSVFVMSTGVIGVQLPMDKMLAGIPLAVHALEENGWAQAARAIMTTDTRPKLVSRTLELSDGAIHLTGIAKGAGMIHPNMATMLGMIATDASIAPELLQMLLTRAVNHSFNSISVDGDTSTNDTVLLLANGASSISIDSPESALYDTFLNALTEICVALAQEIVRDGEGATRFVTISVHGAPADEDAHKIANTVATSPLVKTALFGGDANWGRVLAAVGRAGVPLEIGKVALTINGGEDATNRLGALQIVAGGMPLHYSEAKATAIFAQPEIDLAIDLGQGTGVATVWTTDLSYDYVKINGDYRT